MSTHPEFVLRNHIGEVQDAKFHPTLWKIVSGDNRGEIIVWNLDKRRPESRFEVSSEVLSVSWTGPDFERVLVQKRGGNISIRDINDKDAVPIFNIATEHYGFCKACVLDEKKIAIPGTKQGVIELWDVPSSQKTSEFVPETDLGVCTVIEKFGNDTNAVVAGYEAGTVALWDLTKAIQPIGTQSCCSSPITCLEVDSKAKSLVVGSNDAFFVAMKTDSTFGSSQRKIALESSGLSSITTRSDRCICASGGADSVIRFWKYRNMRSLGSIEYHQKEITNVQFHRNHHFMSASRDGSISIWNVYGSS